jgi:hypothetical protein
MQDSFGIAGGAIWQAVELLWSWSFGQIVTMFQMPLNTLPLWKQLLFLIVVGSLARLGYIVVKGLRKALQSLVGATVGFVAVLLSLVPQIFWAGLIAFGGAWAITHLDPSFIPAGMQ